MHRSLKALVVVGVVAACGLLMTGAASASLAARALAPPLCAP